MTIRCLGAEKFHAGGRTDMTKLTVAFRSFIMCTYVSMILGQQTVLQAKVARFLHNLYQSRRFTPGRCGVISHLLQFDSAGRNPLSYEIPVTTSTPY